MNVYTCMHNILDACLAYIQVMYSILYYIVQYSIQYTVYYIILNKYPTCMYVMHTCITCIFITYDIHVYR